jgi:hypothetical protein
MAPWKRFSFLLFCLACPLLIWSQTGLASLAGAEVSLENPSTDLRSNGFNSSR